MKNKIQDGKSLDMVAPAGGVVSGNAYAVGALVVVASVSAAEGEMFAGERDAVFELVKETPLTINKGDEVYLKAGLVSDDDTATLMGIAVEDAASAAATVKVLVK